MVSNRAQVPYQTTLLVRDGCLCRHRQRAARARARGFDEAPRLLGLTNGNFRCLCRRIGPSRPRWGRGILRGDRSHQVDCRSETVGEAWIGHGSRRSRGSTQPLDDSDAEPQDPVSQGCSDLGAPPHQEIEGVVPNGDPNRLRGNLSALSKG